MLYMMINNMRRVMNHNGYAYIDNDLVTKVCLGQNSAHHKHVNKL